MTESRTEIDAQITEWRSETVADSLVAARAVQDRLLDLYGAVRAYPIATQVEEWLRSTRERNYYEASEIVELLDELETELARHPAEA